VTVDHGSQKRLVETREALSRLVQRERDLSGEVDELRIQPIGVDEETHLASVRRRREAMRPGRTVGIIENILDDTDDSDNSRTIVAEVPKPAVELSKEDYGDLVGRLKEAVGNYGLPYASPRDLDPDLPRLVAATGDQGARGVIDVYEYSQELMRNLDTTVGMLQRRVDGLLAKAQSDYSSNSAASKSKSGGGYYKPQHSQYVEQLQRLLELSDKKIDIKKDQRDRLLRFQDKLGKAFGQLGSVEATRYLAKEFSRQEKNPALRTRILASFRQGRTLHAVPTLIKGLKARDMKLKSSVEATLVAITGVKLGDARAPWEAWWKANGDG